MKYVKEIDYAKKNHKNDNYNVLNGLSCTHTIHCNYGNMVFNRIAVMISDFIMNNEIGFNGLF